MRQSARAREKERAKALRGQKRRGRLANGQKGQKSQDARARELKWTAATEKEARRPSRGAWRSRRRQKRRHEPKD